MNPDTGEDLYLEYPGERDPRDIKEWEYRVNIIKSGKRGSS
jgi:hypothetical protein